MTGPMDTPRSSTVLVLSPAGFHRMAFVERGPVASRRAIVCVHGLTRNARDFDRLASALSLRGMRVVCPDVIGRGASDWRPDPALYAFPQYLSDMTALLARLDVDEVDWVGTSMGGLIGMMMAAQPNSPVRRLVMNDVGAMIPAAALADLARYVGTDPAFDDLDAVEAYLRRVHAGMGPIPDDAWRQLAVHSSRTDHDGRLRLAYDPAIGNGLKASEPQDVVLWPIWSHVRCPTLVLRGERSTMLSAETAAKMADQGTHVRLEIMPDCGHAPSLMVAAQIDLIMRFLQET